MSLLLDALKKAADDKQKALQAESSDSALTVSALSESDQDSVRSDSAFTNGERQNPVDDQDLPVVNVATITDEVKVVTGVDDTEVLTLEEVTDDIAEAKSAVVDTENLSLDEIEQDQDVATESLHLEDIGRASSGEFTVSDDALSMLIYKTNREVKRSKKIVMAGALSIGMAVLITGGVYYYLDMQAEISMLERKHQIAMQSMRAKTNNEKAPEKSEIIEKLVSKSNLDEKVEYAKQRISDSNNSFDRQGLNNKKAGKSNRDIKSSPALSIQKNNKLDHVGEKLDAAWLAYESGRYDVAKVMYKDILSIEKNNRDALLGLGAIAVIEKDNAVARYVYLAVLEQDPRDSMATAALASLHDESALESDEQYLISMLEKNPGAQHLNFALGNNYAKQNKWQSAQQHYFDAWQSDDENADYIFNLAVSMDQLNKQQQAVSFYKDSLVKAVNKQVSFSRQVVQKRIKELSE